MQNVLILLIKKMYRLDEEKIECAFGNRDILFLAGQESRECRVFYFLRRDSRNYLSLTLGTAALKQLHI